MSLGNNMGSKMKDSAKPDNSSSAKKVVGKKSNGVESGDNALNDLLKAYNLKDIEALKTFIDSNQKISNALNENSLQAEFSLDGAIVSSNNQFLSKLGYKNLSETKELKHASFHDSAFAKSEDYNKLWKELTSGSLVKGEFKFSTAKGENILLSAKYSPIKDNKGKINGVMLIADEIAGNTNDNQSNQSLQDSINLGLNACVFKLDGTLISVNSNFLELMGYADESELKGEHYNLFFPDEDIDEPEFEKFWEDLGTLKDEDSIFQEELRKKEDGNYIWLHSTYSAMKNDNGEIDRVLMISTDVTRQKMAVQELKRVVETVTHDGDLTTRAFTEGSEGSDRELLEKINELLDNIGTPILELKDALKKLAEGDLTAAIELESKGDMKEMSDAFTAALKNLNGLLGTILINSNLIGAASSEVLDKSNQMHGTTNEVSSAIDEMAQGVQSQAQQIDESSQLIEELRVSAESMSRTAQRIDNAAAAGQESVKAGLSTVKLVVESMSGIQSSAQVTSESINVLTQRSEEIAKTLNVITDIASQTNLLALNAAIEAARAGDAGRGFAVVAEEIRKLAEDSRKSAGNIESVINAVGKDILSAEKAISEMESSVDSGTKASNEAEDVFNKIENSTSETLNLSQEVLNATEIQKASINGIVKNIEKIVVVSEETATGTEEIATSTRDLNNGMLEFKVTSENLSEIAEQLQEGVLRFKLTSM